MQTRRKIISGAIAALSGVFVGLAPAAHADSKVSWRMASGYGPNAVVTHNLELFVKDVEELSNGRFVIDLKSNGTLFKMPQIKRAVQTGQVELGEMLLTAYSNESIYFEVDGIPGLVHSPEDIHRLWDLTKGPIADHLSSSGISPVFAQFWTGTGLYSREPVTKREDFASLKQRVYSPSTSRFAELMGSTPVLIQYSEFGQALALGTVNSFIGSPAAIKDAKGWESLTYFYETGLTRPKNMVVVNNDAYEKLPNDLKEVLAIAAQKAEDRSVDMVLAAEEVEFGQLEEQGMIRGEVTPEVAEFLAEIGDVMATEWAEKAGPEGIKLLSQVRE